MGMARVRNGLRQTLPCTSGARVPSTDVHPHRKKLDISWCKFELAGGKQYSSEAGGCALEKGWAQCCGVSRQFSTERIKVQNGQFLRLQQGFHVRHTCVRVTSLARTSRAIQVRDFVAQRLVDVVWP